jgi:PqqD family protein of HPr-rel-A system
MTGAGTGTDCPVRSADLDISPVDDGCVVYDPATDMVHHLNQTAAMVLELCTGQDSTREITAFLSQVFPAAGSVAETVAACVAQLRERGLLQPAAAQARWASRAQR